MSDIGEAILQSISQLGARVDARLAAVEAQLTAVSGELTAVKRELTAVKRELTAMGTRLTTVEARLAHIEEAVADTDLLIRAWPDMHFLAAAVKSQIAHTRDLKTEMADVKVRLKEIYQAMATDAEIAGLRDEVGRFRDQSLDVEIRLGTIESRLGASGEPTA